jgi:predicted O-linked N-acetylglucosamine transferase (SPINDLY family)
MNIGYFSPDFKRHSVAWFVEPLLAAHDQSRFKIFCYGNVASPDATTKRIADSCEEWRDIARLGDEWVGDLVRADRIDILVDLAGHTGDGRPLLFARKLAPVQVTWLGYPNTTGIAAIDYRLTDAVADPEDATDRSYVEKLVRLESGFLCYGPPPEAPEVAALPLAGADHVTFGCFNNLAKVTSSMIALWARLLGALPGARLKLKSFGLAAESARRSIQEQFGRLGIGAERLELSGPEESFAAHLAKYAAVDIALDVFPYNGAATTCEALWMGVPVVTLAGSTHVSRVGASILGRVGLEELVAHSHEDYLQKALSLANDPLRLGALRTGMRERLRASPFLDAQGFARSLEKAYGEMWDTWVRSEEAAEGVSPPQLGVVNTAP